VSKASQLRIESHDEKIVNDYRLFEGKLQFRPVRADGSLLPGEAGAWRDLASDDIAKHSALQTVVAEWLAIRKGEKSPVPNCLSKSNAIRAAVFRCASKRNARRRRAGSRCCAAVRKPDWPSPAGF